MSGLDQIASRVSAARAEAEARGETFYPGASRIHLAAFPPTERWDDWVELESTDWPRRTERHYMLAGATRFNGAMPTFDNQRSTNVPVEWFTQAASFIQQLGPGSLDIALEGATDGLSAARLIAPYADAGMTWGSRNSPRIRLVGTD